MAHILLATMIAVLTACGTPSEPAFRVELLKAEDSVAIAVASGDTTVTITSRSGIGRALFVRTGEEWPRRLVVRLKLKGLESLYIASDTFRCRVSLQGPQRVPYWKVGSGDRDADTPEGMVEVNLVRTDGGIDVVVPELMTRGNPRTIRLEWVDFFRG